MQPQWYQPLSEKNRQKSSLCFLANDAPSSANNLASPNTYNTGYHQQIFDILKGLGVNVWSSHQISDIIDLPEHINYVFTLFNRANFNNSEVFVSSVCEWKKVPYLGARPNIRAIAEDKHIAKVLARSIGIPTSDWILCRKNEPIPEKPEFEGPFFVKWRFGASSRYIDTNCIAENWQQARLIISNFHTIGYDVIVEKLITGKGLTVPVLLGRDDKPVSLPAVVTDSDRPFELVTHEQARKKAGGIRRRLFEDSVLSEQIKRYSETLFEAVRPIDYLRVDFKIQEDDSTPLFLEFNVCCNISSSSAICQSASSVGVTQKMLVSHLLEQSLIRQGF